MGHAGGERSEFLSVLSTDLQQYMLTETRRREVQDSLHRLCKLKDAQELAYSKARELLEQHVRQIIQEIEKKRDTMLHGLSTEQEERITEIAQLEEELRGRFSNVSENLTDIRTQQHEQAQTKGLLEGIQRELDEILSISSTTLTEQASVVKFVPSETVTEIGELKGCDISDMLWGSQEVVPRQRLNRSSTPPRPASGSMIVLSAARQDDHDATGRAKSNLRRAKSEPMLNITKKRKAPPVPTLHPKFVRSINKHGKRSGCLRKPTGAILLPNGNIMVAEEGNKRLQEFSTDGTSVRITALGKGAPVDLILTSDGCIAVLNSTTACLNVHTRAGDHLCTFGKGYFKNPQSLAQGPEGYYIIVDHLGAWQQYVVLYNPMTGELRKLGYNDKGESVILHPEHVVMNNQKEVLITDSGNHCVWWCSLDGRVLGKFGSQGSDDGQLSYPKGICVDHRDNIIVADCANHRISVFDSQGEFLRHMLTQTDGLNYPQALNINRLGSVVVTQNSEVLLFQ